MSIYLVEDEDKEKWKKLKELEIERKLLELSSLYRKLLKELAPGQKIDDKTRHEEPKDFIL